MSIVASDKITGRGKKEFSIHGKYLEQTNSWTMVWTKKSWGTKHLGGQVKDEAAEVGRPYNSYFKGNESP